MFNKPSHFVVFIVLWSDFTEFLSVFKWLFFMILVIWSDSDTPPTLKRYDWFFKFGPCYGGTHTLPWTGTTCCIIICVDNDKLRSEMISHDQCWQTDSKDGTVAWKYLTKGFCLELHRAECPQLIDKGKCCRSCACWWLWTSYRKKKKVD